MQKVLNAGYMLIALSFALLAPTLVYAQSGTYFDPINVQIQQDPWDAFVQQSQQQSQSDSLNQSLRNIQNALSNQSQQQAQFQQQQLIQQKQAQCPPNMQVYVSKVSGKIGGCICQPPYSMQNGACQMPQEALNADTAAQQSQQTKSCQDSFGPNAYSGTSGCACLPGYQMGSWSGGFGGLGCVLFSQKLMPAKAITAPTPSKTNNQICQEYYGMNSAWDGTLNAQSAPVCGCQTGYQWNDAQKTCIAVPQTARESGGGCAKGYTVASATSGCVANADICRADYGDHSVWTGNLNSTGGPVCECRSGYQFSSDQCVPIPKLEKKEGNPVVALSSTPTDEEKPASERRGFWSWILGLFGI